MRVESFSYEPGRGWSVEAFPAMDSGSTALFVFGGSRYLDDDAPLLELAAAYPTSHLIGCSTSGEIVGPRIHDDSIVAAVVRFEHTKVTSGAAAVRSIDDSFEAGRVLARSLEHDDLRALIVLSVGDDVNGSELSRGIRSATSDSVVVTGGLAGDADRFERTWVLLDGRPVRHHVQALGLHGGHVRVGHGSGGGWDAFGPERLVTRSLGSCLIELDGAPALPIYRRYLGEEAAGLPATARLYPLSIRTERETFVRTVLGIDEKTQTMTFAGDIPQGARAQFMMASGDRLVGGAAESARATLAQCGGDAPVLALAVSCAGRRLVLGGRAEEELEVVADVLPEGSAMLGFYSYGEISPGGLGACTLHNQTMTLTAIAEDAPHARAA